MNVGESGQDIEHEPDGDRRRAPLASLSKAIGNNAGVLAHDQFGSDVQLAVDRTDVEGANHVFVLEGTASSDSC